MTMNISQDDLDFINNWYAGIESGYKAMGKSYTRPKDYIERATRVIEGRGNKNKNLNNSEGKKSYPREEF